MVCRMKVGMSARMMWRRFFLGDDGQDDGNDGHGDALEGGYARGRFAG